MGHASTNGKAYKLVHLELLPVLAFTHNFDVNQINAARQIGAAVVNVSGRQRMLCQRTALFCLKLVRTQDKGERENLRSQLRSAIDLMEKSHKALIEGDPEMKLPGDPSTALKVMYFQPPLNLDRQIRNYITHLRIFAESEDKLLTQENSHLRYILDATSAELLDALDAVVTQYQKESEAEQLALDCYLAQLYQQSCIATATAQAQAQQLEKTLQDLQQAQAQLIHAERISSLGHLVAGLAHEINNPVNFIHGNLSYANTYVQELIELLYLYQQEYSQTTPAIEAKIKEIDLYFLLEDFPQVLSSMKIGVDRIRQIVQSLRVFSRADEEEMKPVDVREGIDSTLLILHSRLKAKDKQPDIKVIKEYGDLPPVVCYAGQLNQVFMNLLSNAIDALETVTVDSVREGKSPIPTIWIRTEILHPDYVTVRIADNGSGMTAETKARLFDRFFTTKPIGKGTGLGLSISHQIVVEKHGGTLRCVSTPGQGTEFTIEMPIRSRDRAGKLPNNDRISLPPPSRQQPNRVIEPQANQNLQCLVFPLLSEGVC